MKTKRIKTFQIDGVAVDQEAIIRLRPELESRIIEDMRASGYVPCLDLTPELFWEYVQEKEAFSYIVVIYGCYLGKKRALEVLGLLGSHEIMMEPNNERFNDADSTD
jgi:hypothetical protein